MNDNRKTHEGFVQGTEAYLASVWYVMKDAEASYHKNRHRLERGRLNPWAYLNRVKRLLGLGPAQVPYSVMRAELLEFAETFGVRGEHPDAPIAERNRNAQKEFSP